MTMASKAGPLRATKAASLSMTACWAASEGGGGGGVAAAESPPAAPESASQPLPVFAFYARGVSGLTTC